MLSCYYVLMLPCCNIYVYAMSGAMLTCYSFCTNDSIPCLDLIRVLCLGDSAVKLKMNIPDNVYLLLVLLQ